MSYLQGKWLLLFSVYSCAPDLLCLEYDDLDALKGMGQHTLKPPSSKKHSLGDNLPSPSAAMCTDMQEDSAAEI